VAETTPRALTVVGGALDTYRAEFRRVAAAALLVLVPVALLTSAVEEAIAGIPPDTDSSLVNVILLGVYIAIGGSLGSTFFSGLLDKLVGHHQLGHPRLSITEVMRVLPYGRLWVANLILVAATVAGALLFVVPGIIAFTLFALVGPIITVQDCSVSQAIGTSARLVRPHFLLVLVTVTLAVAVEQGLHQLVHTLLHDRSEFIAALFLDGVFAATVGALIGLVEVTLTYVLLARSGGLPTATVEAE
jgi:hypothetical protein